MDELTASGKAEPASEPAATSVNTSAYTQLLLDTLSSSFDNHLLDSDLSIHSYNSQIQTLTSMADRFPSLEDFSEGTLTHYTPYSGANITPGQTEVAEAPTATDDDFLARERAALGEDADQFATAQDHVGENVGGDDDLLGGDEPVEELGQFESSFPSVETQNQNEVCIGSKRHQRQYTDQGFHLSSALLLVAQLPAPAHLSPVPATQTPRNPKMKAMLSGKCDHRFQTTWRIASGARWVPIFGSPG